MRLPIKDRKLIPRGFKLLRIGEKLTLPYYVFRLFGELKKEESDQSYIGRPCERCWSNCLVKK